MVLGLSEAIVSKTSGDKLKDSITIDSTIVDQNPEDAT